MSNLQPVIFVGHGSPMNIVEKNQYTSVLQNWGHEILNNPPKAIVVISAHWITKGTQITAVTKNKIQYDFYGFPEELYEAQYESNGSLDIADDIKKNFQQNSFDAELNPQWSLDHGAWAVLTHMFPNSNIPVLQISLDAYKSPEEHYKMGQSLQKLRKDGILVISSGNITHNLRKLSWNNDAPIMDWAANYENKVTSALDKKDYETLIHFQKKWPAETKEAHPTVEHFFPLLYTIGASFPDENIDYKLKLIQNASISMTSFQFSK